MEAEEDEAIAPLAGDSAKVDSAFVGDVRRQVPKQVARFTDLYLEVFKVCLIFSRKISVLLLQAL